MAERSKSLQLSCRGLAGCGFESRWRHIFSFWIFSLPPRSEQPQQVNGAVANEIKHVHSPEVIVVLDPRYDLSYKALYISTCSIALSLKTVTTWIKTSTYNFLIDWKIVTQMGNTEYLKFKRKCSYQSNQEFNYLGNQGGRVWLWHCYIRQYPSCKMLEEDWVISMIIVRRTSKQTGEIWPKSLGLCLHCDIEHLSWW